MAGTFNRRELMALFPAALLTTQIPVGLDFADEELFAFQAAPGQAGTMGQTLSASFPSQDPQMIFAIVAASHGNLDQVKTLLAQSPDLAKAGWDWGFGDWETAIGAAAHTGQREIAKVLMENGARADIFTHAMLGHLDAVKAIVAAQPGIQKVLGPHGITLAQHARLGGEPAKATLDYLVSLGDADTPRPNQPITDAEKETFLGTYQYGKTEAEALVVSKDQRGNLNLKAGAAFTRSLRRVGPAEFETSGSIGTRVVFVMEGGKASEVKILTPAPLVTGKRVR